MASSVRLQLKLVACHLAGIVAAIAAIPYLLAAGLDLRSVVLTSVLGFAAFLVLATVGGLLGRHFIEARPVHAALAMPAVLAASILMLLWALSGFAADGAWLARDAAMIGGLSALFSAVIFLLWSTLSSNR